MKQAIADAISALEQHAAKLEKFTGPDRTIIYAPSDDEWLELSMLRTAIVEIKRATRDSEMLEFLLSDRGQRFAYVSLADGDPFTREAIAEAMKGRLFQ